VFEVAWIYQSQPRFRHKRCSRSFRVALPSELFQLVARSLGFDDREVW